MYKVPKSAIIDAVIFCVLVFRVIGSELVQKYVGEGARMVRELFQMARSKKACIVFFDEVDAIGGARFDDGAGGDNEVQRTMLEIVNQLDGFDSRGNIKVIFRIQHALKVILDYYNTHANQLIDVSSHSIQSNFILSS